MKMKAARINKVCILNLRLIYSHYLHMASNRLPLCKLCTHGITRGILGKGTKDLSRLDSHNFWLKVPQEGGNFIKNLPGFMDSSGHLFKGYLF